METKVVELRVNLGKSEEELNKLTKGFKKADEAATQLDATFEEIYGDLQPLTTRMGEAEDRLYELALAGQQATQEYRDLLNSVANYRQTQIQTDQVVDAAATTLGQKLGGAAQIAATGVQGVTAGMALFRAESVDTEKALLQVQSAMAFADAIAGVSSLRGQFTVLKLAIESSSVATKINTAATAGAAIVQKLFTGAVTTTTVGFKALKFAIIATGIGALVVGVGLLVANFEKVKEVVFKFIPGLENAGKAIMNIVNSVTDFIGVTSQAGRAIDKQKALAEKSLKQNERYLKLNEHVLSESRKKEIALANEHFQRLIDGEFTKEQSLKIVREKAEIERRKKSEEINKILAEKNKVAQDKAEAERAKQNEKILSERKAYLDKASAFDEQNTLKAVDTEKLQRDANIVAMRNDLTTKIAIGQNYVEESRRQAADRIKIGELEAQAKQNQLEGIGNALAQAAQIAGESTSAGKALAIASTTISTYSAAQKAYESAFLPVPTVASPALGAVFAGVAVAGGLMNIKKILSVKTPKSGGGSAPSSGGIQAPPSIPNFNVVGTSGQNQIAQTLNREQPPVKAYIVYGDVKTAAAHDRNIVKASSVG